MRVNILMCSDWEAMFIDDKLIDEGHELGEGDNFMYMLIQSEKYGFKRSDVLENFVVDEDNSRVYKDGNFPSDMKELSGYEKYIKKENK